MPRGKTPVVEPALTIIYGSKLKGKSPLECIEHHFQENFQDMTADEVISQINKDLKLAKQKPLTQGNIYSFAKSKLNWKFKRKSKKGISRPSPVYDKFIKTCGGEDKVKTELETLIDLPVKEATARFNEDNNTKFSPSNLISFAGKFDLEFKKTRKGRKKATKEESETPTPSTKDPIVVHYKCREEDCGHEYCSTTSETPPNTKARRCRNCKKWATYLATWEQNGQTFRQATVKKHLGKGRYIDSDTLVDENFNVVNSMIPDVTQSPNVPAKDGEKLARKKETTIV